MILLLDSKSQSSLSSAFMKCWLDIMNFFLTPLSMSKFDLASVLRAIRAIKSLDRCSEGQNNFKRSCVENVMLFQKIKESIQVRKHCKNSYLKCQEDQLWQDEGTPKTREVDDIELMYIA